MIGQERNMLDEALAYMRMGFSVIPVKGPFLAKGKTVEEKSKDAKAPLVAWTAYRQERPTEEEARSWFARWPKANVAIVTGKISGLVVVDLDSKDAIDWARSQGLLSETATVSTPRGIHGYFRCPDRTIGNSVNVNGMHIDVRGEGGYAIAPPSVHLSGMEYTWLRRPEDGIADLPEPFRTTDQKEHGSLREFYGGVGKGRRNDTLARLCGSWLRDGLSCEECLDMAKAWNEKNDPPLPAEEVERTVRSIWRKHNLNSPSTQVFYHEKNLLRFPLFVYSKNKIHKPGMIRLTVIENQKLKREWSVTSYRGLPGPFDEAIFMAINKIISEKPKPITNPVGIASLKNLAKMIGYDISGRTIKSVREAIQRLHDLRITSNMTYYDANRKRYIIDCFGLFERVIFTGEIIDETEETAKTTCLWLNPAYLRNVNSNYVSPISLETYISLRGYIAKGIYRHLAPIMPLTKGLPIKISYDRLADKLQIEKETEPWRIRHQLKDAHDELVKKGVFRKISFFEKTDKHIILYQA